MQPVTQSPQFDPEHDFEGLRICAESKDPVAQYELGKAFRDGKGVEADAIDAVYWFRLAATAGNPDAQFDLACLYEFGTQVKGDLPEAVRLYTQAAESGHAEAQNALGSVLEAGGADLEPDMITAVRWYKKAAQQGFSIAQGNYGRCFLYGNGVAFNGQEAFKWLNKATESDPKNAYPQYYLGVCYRFGCAGEQDYAKAYQWYEKAAENGMMLAQNDLARCYETGEGVEKNVEQALRWYKKAADNGSKEAKLKVVELAEIVASAEAPLSYAEKEALLWEPANGGNAEAAYRYAMHLKTGPQPDWPNIAKWLKWAGNCGNEQGWIELAKMYEIGEGVEKDPIEAVSILMGVQERGGEVESEILRCLTDCFENQLYPDGAEEWLNKQARRNNPKVMICLATYWRSENPDGRNFNEAIKWYRKACNLGDRDAQYLLGRFLIMKNLLNRERLRVVRWWETKLEKGMGDAASTTEFDEDTERGQDKAYEQRSEALKWLHSAADEGSTEALRFLSAMYNRGISLMANPETAIQHLRRAAELEDAKAQGLLGVAILSGIGTKKNERQAVEWLKRGSENGDSFAQWNLAMCLLDGIGVDVDRQSARQLLERSAEGKFEQDRFWTEEEFALRFDQVIQLFRMLESNGQKEAQYWLGLCYELGIGTERDRDRSVELYYLSSEQGYEPAKRILAQVPENLQALAKKRLGS